MQHKVVRMRGGEVETEHAQQNLFVANQLVLERKVVAVRARGRLAILELERDGCCR